MQRRKVYCTQLLQYIYLAYCATWGYYISYNAVLRTFRPATRAKKSVRFVRAHIFRVPLPSAGNTPPGPGVQWRKNKNPSYTQLFELETTELINNVF